MKNKLAQGLVLLIIFTIFIVNGEKLLPESFDKMQLGIIHFNSLFFIGLSACILYLSIDKDIKKANRLHKEKETSVKEAIIILENFFEEKISIKELLDKSKSNETIEKIIKIVQYGGIEEDLGLGVDRIFTTISSKYIKLKNDYEYLATIMPIIGMVGTISGLLIMFAIPEGVEDFAGKFSGLSIALATTLYASLVTILFFKPKARGVEEWIIDLETDYEYCNIAVKQFYHKIDVLELTTILESDNNVQDKTKEL